MKNIRTLLVVALIAIAGATPLHALELSPNGIGQVLIYPYYTVNKNQDTWFTINNTQDDGMVVKVRFLEGYKGRPVLDLDVYLAANDVWTAAITRSSNSDGAVLLTSDRSCTSPSVPDSGLVFSSAGYDGSGSLPADAGPQGIARTREGFIEVIAGAQILPGTATEAAITPVQTGTPGEGTPPGCGDLPGSLFADLRGVRFGVYGTATIINVGEGTLFAYTPEAITHFSEVPLYRADNGPLEPSLAQASSSASDVGGAVAYVVANHSDGSQIRGPASYDFAHGIDAVTALFMSDAIYNEYLVSPSLAAETDWIVTFPTKRFYVDPIYGYSDGFNAEDLGFSGRFGYFKARVSDREGGVAYPVVGPLAYDANVVTFKNDAPTGSVSGVFGSHLNTNIRPYGDRGLARLRFSWDTALSGPTLVDDSPNMNVMFGQPVTGFMAYRIINDHAQPGLLASYGGTYRHRASACSTFASLNMFVCLRPSIDP